MSTEYLGFKILSTTQVALQGSPHFMEDFNLKDSREVSDKAWVLQFDPSIECPSPDVLASIMGQR